VDKNDAVAVYRVVYEAIDKARRGAGATLIRCVQQTISAKGRGEDERVDPIAYMEHYLRKRNLWTDDLRF
jgi:TPP-dependent pyruvate/acetoin dehydrogenase alpha subunit